jgi:hypothetical protein
VCAEPEKQAEVKGKQAKRNSKKENKKVVMFLKVLSSAGFM